ncbi:hypothetical protein LguiA_011079 [Lonicera macranthoides]
MRAKFAISSTVEQHLYPYFANNLPFFILTIVTPQNARKITSIDMNSSILYRWQSISATTVIRCADVRLQLYHSSTNLRSVIGETFFLGVFH